MQGPFENDRAWGSRDSLAAKESQVQMINKEKLVAPFADDDWLLARIAERC